jgi:hypothetical protein
MATVAHWTKAQLTDPTRWLLGWPTPSRVCSAPAHRVVTMRCATSARGVVQCSPARRRLNGDEAFTPAILMGASTSHNTKNWEREVRMGSSPARQTAQRQPKVSAAKTSPRLEKELLARFLCCKEVARTLG